MDARRDLNESRQALGMQEAAQKRLRFQIDQVNTENTVLRQSVRRLREKYLEISETIRVSLKATIVPMGLVLQQQKAHARRFKSSCWQLSQERVQEQLVSYNQRRDATNTAITEASKTFDGLKQRCKALEHEIQSYRHLKRQVEADIAVSESRRQALVNGLSLHMIKQAVRIQSYFRMHQSASRYQRLRKGADVYASLLRCRSLRNFATSH